MTARMPESQEYKDGAKEETQNFSMPPSQMGRILLEPLNHGMAAAVRKSFELGVPAHSVVEMLINHIASVIAMIEPEGAREECLREVVHQIGPMVTKHYDARFMSKGGIHLPPGAARS